MKLTKPQIALLDELYRHNRNGARKSVSTNYQPAIALAKRGFANWQTGSFTDWLVITAAGIAEHERKPND